MRGPLGEILDKTGDGGDSCNFTCAYAFFGGSTVNHWFFTNPNARPVRHPKQKPWKNPRNFSRDQAVPLIAVTGERYARWFFKRHWLFLPNTERDWPGSKKLPYPHWHFKDSMGGKNNKTLMVRNYSFIFGPARFFPEEVFEFKWFDSADLVTPDFFGMMVLKGKLKWLYPTLPLAFLWCLLSVLSFCYLSKSNDFKQLYITSTFYKLDKLFWHLHPRGLENVSHKYFVIDRDLGELHEAFLGYASKRGYGKKA